MAPDDRLKRKLTAIFFTDVVGYSRLTGEDEEGTYRLVRDRLDLISESIQSHNGAVINYAGDAILADFPTASEALTCAAEMQRGIEKANEPLPEDRKVRFRIGVNLGEVIVDRDSIYGDGVNVAARLEALAEPGGICISEAVHGAVGMGGERREDQHDSDGAGEHRQIVLHAREREKPRSGRGSNNTETRHSRSVTGGPRPSSGIRLR